MARAKSRKKSKTTSKSQSGGFHHPVPNPCAAFSQAKRAQNEQCGPKLISGPVDARTRVVLPLFMSSDLTLYSRAMCSWCIDAKDFLQARGYKFVEVDVGQIG